ncbi:hypothetical protein HGRIS_002627 [Hohenbuehelia grisea]|uniref:SET domain-containing protein n=1 Tax=Hohenbuehelia grisea TaxID=104357 RepID=A0ABR3JLQ7_9AGAR
MPRVKQLNGFPAAKGAVMRWSPTRIMNVHDLSNDDDFLTRLLVEKLGPSLVPLYVHKMNTSRRPIKVDPAETMNIVRRLVTKKVHLRLAIKQAVDELLTLPSVRFYLQNKTQKQINAFSTHASRYLELYQPSGCIEIAHTSRYSHRTGKSELCILATRPLAKDVVITELKGSMANLTEEEDKELKRTTGRDCHSDIRRDFSVIHSKQMKKNHLFLGPARFVNHDCDNNCDLFREGRYITFRTKRPISVGEEITTHYGAGYFGRKNKNCLCKTCEDNGRGGFAPDHTSDDEGGSSSDSGSDSDSSESNSRDSPPGEDSKGKQGLNERRTRRGVYAIIHESSDDSDDSDEEAEADSGEVVDGHSDLTPLASSRSPSNVGPGVGLMTPEPDSISVPVSRASTLTSISSVGSPSKSTQSTPFRSIISTRRQKAQEAATTRESEKPGHPATPSSSEEPIRSSSRLAGKQKAPTPSTSKVDKGKAKEVPKVKREEVDSRPLRGRTSALPEEVVEPPKPDVPRGDDGKPLPLCVTCSNVLPVMCVDDQVVWGLDLSRKKAKAECPRCMRHFHIYQQTWPNRVVSRSSHVLPTPREDTSTADTNAKRVTTKALQVLDKKLAGEKHRREREMADEHSAKRQRMGNSAPKVNMSSKAKKDLLDAAAKKLQARKVGRPPLTTAQSEPRKRGRPRLSSPRARPPPPKAVSAPAVVPAASEADVDVARNDHATSVLDQPRDSNGRFGRKAAEKAAKSALRLGNHLKPVTQSPLSRAERVVERERVKTYLEQQAESSRKRAMETDDEDEETTPSLKRRHFDMEEKQEVEHQQEHEPSYPVRNTSASLFRGGLLARPAPYAMARHFLQNPSEDESSTDDNGPFTPEDQSSPPAVEIASEDSDHSFRPVAVPARRSFGAFKPSPYMYAKRRWASSSTPVADQNDAGSSTSSKTITYVEHPLEPAPSFGQARAPGLASPLSSISSLSSCESSEESEGNGRLGPHGSFKRPLLVREEELRAKALVSVSPTRQNQYPPYLLAGRR